MKYTFFQLKRTLSNFECNMKHTYLHATFEMQFTVAQCRCKYVSIIFYIYISRPAHSRVHQICAYTHMRAHMAAAHAVHANISATITIDYFPYLQNIRRIQSQR